MVPSRKSWSTPWTICLNASIWRIMHRAAKDNFLTTLVSWGTQNAPNKSLRERMSTHPTPTSGQRRYCRKHTIPFHICPALRKQPQFLLRIPTILDKGRQTDIILFQRCHLLALQHCGISFNSLGNAGSISVCVHTKRYPPCMLLEDWAHCSTGEDIWQNTGNMSS